jgi:hypothetical protein
MAKRTSVKIKVRKTGEMKLGDTISLSRKGRKPKLFKLIAKAQAHQIAG